MIPNDKPRYKYNALGIMFRALILTSMIATIVTTVIYFR